MKHLYYTLLILLFGFNAISQTADCGNTPAGELTVNDSCVYTTMNSDNNTSYWDANTFSCGASQNDDVWAWFTATGTSTTITYNNNDGDAIIHLFEGSSCSQSMTDVACADNEVISNPETIVYPTTIGTVYHIRVQNYGTDATMNGEICVSSITDGLTCAKSLPFCTGTTENFPALTDNIDIDVSAGPEKYGCLQSAPNPTWYYLKIGTSGTIDIQIDSDCGDVDYAAWGPFSSISCGASLTGTYQDGFAPGPGGTPHAYEAPHVSGNYSNPEGVMVDCAYSNAANETLNIPNAIVGEYYMLMITNFANCPGNITFSQVSGTGATDCTVLTSLPVELQSFKVTPDENSVRLNWETVTEINNDFFTIEKSIDGINDFKEIATIKGAGNSTQLQKYSYVDNEELRGVLYYRLKQTDFNGDFKYSNTIATEIKGNNKINVFPNPSMGKFKVQGKDIQRVKVISTDGFVMYEGNSTNIDLSSQPKGVYIVEIITRNNVKRTKIFIH